MTSCLAIAGVAAAAFFATAGGAEAARKKRHYKPVSLTQRMNRVAPTSAFAGAPNYSALVVDAKTGRTLYERNPDDLRFPASVTKVMTLYLVFEDLERGRIRLDNRIVMSAHCAAEAPSKLGMRPGSSIDVEGGIKALVTKSANDVACAFAENLDGSVPNFAERMTRKARAIGMTRSVFRNASGLPNPTHVTTARDLVTLGRAIQDRFPRYYGYFGTRAYTFAGRTMPNHNKLLGRVEGVDGIKTGYTNASGFNLLTSVKSQGRSIVAVVMGGRTGPSRDANMRELIAMNLPKAQSGSRTAPLVAENQSEAPVRAARPAVMASVPAPLAAAPALPEREERVASLGGVPYPTPAPIMTPVPASSGATPKALPRLVSSAERPVIAATIPLAAAPALAPAPIAASPTTTPGSMRWVVGRQPTVTGSVGVREAVAEEQEPQVELASAEETDEAPAPVAAPARPVRAAPQVAAVPSPVARKGWLIQIGATAEETGAEALLSNAKAKGGSALRSAEPFTEPFTKGGSTYYRARFAGLNEKSADAACKALKRSSVSCFAIKN
jgi:D-alanyl-D-alanine carboxypeptidase